MILKNLLSEPIHWKFNSEAGGYYGLWNDEMLFLRLNDFPDEPLYTLIFGLEEINVEDRPPAWTFEQSC